MRTTRLTKEILFQNMKREGLFGRTEKGDVVDPLRWIGLRIGQSPCRQPMPARARGAPPLARGPSRQPREMKATEM